VGLKARRPPRGDSGRNVAKNVEIQVRLVISQGNNHRDLLHGAVVDRLKEIITQEWPAAEDGTRGALVTPTGGYYLIDGVVCLVADFDPETMDRKPGTLPPSWSLGPGDEKKAAILAERNEVQKNWTNHMAKQPEKLLTTYEIDQSRTPALKEDPAPKILRKPAQVIAPSPPPAALKRKAK
jgi:hypothetical protein